jgi:hypothetical protein
MQAFNARSSTAAVNYVNIGLIFLSFAIALYLPFALFLFAYAILGPAHYLTEISWLHKRHFFTKGSYDAWLLAGLATVTSVLAVFKFGLLKQMGASHNLATVIGVAFGSALIFLLTEKPQARVMGLALVTVVSLIAVNTSAFVAMVLALFVPTLIHVYVFTGFFILFGALKERSVSGYVTFACFLLCPILYLFIQPVRIEPSNYIVQSYRLSGKSRRPSSCSSQTAPANRLAERSSRGIADECFKPGNVFYRA